jgi:hypothetical protein
MHGPNSKGAGVCSTNAPETHNNQPPHFANDDGDGKALATMTAQAARCGCALHELASGGYLLCRWGMARELPCLRAVGNMLRRIGGQQQ